MKDEQIKSLFFSQYYGQKVFKFNSSEPQLKNIDTVVLTGYIIETYVNDGYLLLRGVNDLTDEDKIMIAQSYFTSLKGSQFEYQSKDWYDTLMRGFPYEFQQKIYQILTRTGILLPFTYLSDGKPITLSVEELLQKGWVKLKTY